jgi:hypothetical protein
MNEQQLQHLREYVEKLLDDQKARERMAIEVRDTHAKTTPNTQGHNIYRCITHERGVHSKDLYNILMLINVIEGEEL